MRKFIRICRHCRVEYPLLWEHSGYRNRRIIVGYWLPGIQAKLF